MTFNSHQASFVLDFVKGKSFEEIKTICKNEHIKVKELDNEHSNNLYLLVLDEDLVLKNSEYFKSLSEKIQNNQLLLDLAKEKGDFDMYKKILEILKHDRHDLSKYVRQTKLTDTMTDFQLMLNGIILEKDSNKVVSLCYKRMLDLSTKIEEVQTLSYDKIKVEYCEDGTVIRLYNYNNMWFTATRRCIDAKYSYWSGLKNFDEMFWDVIEDKDMFLSSLDKNSTYFFVLKHVENRIVVKNDRSSLVFLGSTNNSSFEESNELSYMKGNIKKVEDVCLDSFSSSDNVNVETLITSFSNMGKRGLIITNLDTQTKYKLDFNEFLQLKELRGNTPHIRMRILELLSDKEKLTTFMQNYSEYAMTYSMITFQLNQLVKYIHKLYIDTHVKHRFVIDSENANFKIIKQLHNKFKETKTPIVYNDVQGLLEKTHPSYLKTLLGWN